MFQQTVVKKYLKTINLDKVEKAWIKYQAHFLNSAIQENIRNSKEEQYQGEFLIDLFVKVLGYTKNPTPNFNLTTELKNVQDSKKADGAIIINDVVKAVIELKSTKTTDLSKVQHQAFNYKTSHPECDVVIISNFEKLRLFIRNQTEYQEFNLFALNKDQFKLLYLLLAHENFEKNLLIKIKDQSLSEEEEITKKLYKDYSEFKRELFQDLIKRNPDYDALTLFQSSQKLLDRFLFLFFAEDRGLLPPNEVREILRQWKKLQELDAYDTLINRFRKYFGYLNTGFEGKKYKIFAYNGGLFAPDEILDTIEISDDILYKYTQQLADYDYQSEVDVNILGHIFENSLNEIDEIKAELAGETIDKSKTKRKKDGVFYTPKYITQYIVENTVGKLCEEQKAKLNINDEDYDPGANYQNKTRAKLEDQLVAYYDWLTQLTICDPACGSGAFLNQALDYLIKEHEYLMQLRQNLYAKDGQIAMAFPFSENDILENNLYGVDINEESVEIAKLSLWLRTAKPNRKLNSLNQNIKVGNSLIDDPEVAGDKAFVWEKEFAHVFEKGGFDVVIGNPPYVRNTMLNKTDKRFYEDNYGSATQQYDLYVLFIEKGLSILKHKGYLSFINLNKFIATSYGKGIRKILLEHSDIIEIKDVSDSNVFIDAAVYPVIITTQKSNYTEIIDEVYDISIYKILNPEKREVLKKIDKDSIQLIKLAEITETIHTGNIRKKLVISKPINENSKRLLRGRDVDRYSIIYKNDLYVNFDNSLIDKSNKEYANLTYKELYENPKIIYRDISLRIQAYYDTDKFYSVNTIYTLILKNEEIQYLCLLPIINSNLLSFWFSEKFSDAHVSGGYLRFKKKYMSLLPIKIPINQELFIEKADQMLSLSAALQKVTDKFTRTLERRFEIEKLSKKLEAWHDLSFAEFVKELKKKKVKLTLAEEAEWEDYFTTEKAKADSQKTQIAQTDKEIDQMVYKLYDLTEEEIAIVENS